MSNWLLKNNLDKNQKIPDESRNYDKQIRLQLNQEQCLKNTLENHNLKTIGFSRNRKLERKQDAKTVQRETK